MANDALECWLQNRTRLGANASIVEWMIMHMIDSDHYYMSFLDEDYVTKYWGPATLRACRTGDVPTWVYLAWYRLTTAINLPPTYTLTVTATAGNLTVPITVSANALVNLINETVEGSLRLRLYNGSTAIIKVPGVVGEYRFSRWVVSGGGVAMVGNGTIKVVVNGNVSIRALYTRPSPPTQLPIANGMVLLSLLAAMVLAIAIIAVLMRLRR